MHDLNSEIWLDARADFGGCVRARGLPARQPARQPAARRRWLLNARTVAKTDVRIVLLSKNWV